MSDEFAFEQVVARVGFELEGGLQEQLELFGRQVGNGDDVLSVKRVGHSVSFLHSAKTPRRRGFAKQRQTMTDAPRHAARKGRVENAGRAMCCL